MNKKFLVGATIVVLAGMGLAIFLLRDEKLGNQGGYTEDEISQKRAAMAAGSGETNAPTQAVLAPIGGTNRDGAGGCARRNYFDGQ